MSSSGDQQQVCLLHGDLELTIHEARGLPNMDSCSSILRCHCFCPWRVGTPSSTSSGSVAGQQNGRTPSGDHRALQTSDPYVAVVVPWGEEWQHKYATLARTHVVRNSEAPRWEARVLLPLAHFTSKLAFVVKDADRFGVDLIGIASIPAADIVASANKGIESLWLPILRPGDDKGRTPKPDGSEICISATFTPVARETKAFWHSLGGVPAYFPLHKGCDVKLYQDAHVAPGEVKGIPGVFEPGRCWEDMCTAVLGARHMVYVVGWSVYTKVKLTRRGVPEAEADVRVEDMSLGDLLKNKSREPGVRVCLLLWEDRNGVMRTHDKETKKFFKGSSVICVLSPRHPSNKLSIVNRKVTKAVYSHHQKCLLVDTPAPGNDSSRRRITAFLGGLDLCDGRYDTPTHTLFRDLDTVFDGDIRNRTFQAEAEKKRGPRQPWHDMHCRLDGKAAYDVLENLQQRWSKLDKATKLWEMLGKATYWREGDLLDLDRVPGRRFAGDAGAGGGDDSRPESWHAQVFRSVDSGSVKGFPSSLQTDDLWKRHLLCKKNVEVDNSIHVAYVKAIRSAERFIYIENQYFIGSSYGWPSYTHRGASNLVPMEIALKVASKIRAGQEFAVYIVIPMWPEGNPNSDQTTQEILYWQSQTMETMYKVIAQEIQRKGLSGEKPQHYLNFYCLGNREEEETAHGPSELRADHPDSSDPAVLARRFRRFMVYVHSKGMIVDDEYIIVGSANINQRSLAGSRDTEIAVGAYQPHHTGPKRLCGKVHGYRMSLWEEHLGREVIRRPELERPESRECVSLVNSIAWDNWKRYADSTEAPGPAPLKGHLMRYPLDVRDDGSVTKLSGHEVFPDVGGSVLGKPRTILPDNFTM